MKIIIRTIILSLALLGVFGALGSKAAPSEDRAPNRLIYEEGDLLRIQVVERPGRVLTYEIEGVARGLLLEEVNPGSYLGEFLILPSFRNGKSKIHVRDLETQTLLSSEDIFIKSSGSRDIHIAEGPNDTIIVGFDDTISATSVVVSAGEEKFTLDDGLESRSNFFELDNEKALQDEIVEVRAQSIDGEELHRVLKK